MKKILFLLTLGLLAQFTFAAQSSTFKSKYVSDSGVRPEIKSVLNSDKLLIAGYTITFEYPVQDIEDAVISRLYKEGLEGNKKKNTYGFKNIKYNLLWPKNFDLYINFMGSASAGTINVILSQGYDNFIIPTADTVTSNKVFKWLTQLDLDIQNYRYNESMGIHLEEQENIQDDLAKLEKEKKKTEKKLSKVLNDQKKLEVSRTVVVEGIPVDPKQIEKEEAKAIKLQREKVSLQTDLEAINKKIAEVKGDLQTKDAVILEMKKNKPRSN